MRPPPPPCEVLGGGRGKLSYPLREAGGVSAALHRPLPAAQVWGPLGVWLQLVPLEGWAAVPAAPGAAGAAGAAHTQASNTPSLGSSWRMRERGREGGHARVSTRPRARVCAAAH